MEINEMLQGVLTRLFSDPVEAEAYAQDPSGYLAAEGISDMDLTDVDLSTTVSDVSNELNMGPQMSTTLTEIAPVSVQQVSSAPAAAAAASGGGGGGGGGASAPTYHAPAPTIKDVEQTINEYVSVVYEGDEHITNNFVDNSTDFDVDFKGDVDGKVDLHIDNDVTNANALGENSVAAGHNAEGVATGEGALAVGDAVKDSQLNTGDGAVQIDGNSTGPINTGVNTGIIADGSVDDTIIGNDNTQLGDIHGSNVAVGDDNTVVGHADDVVSGDGNTLTDVNTHGGDAVVGDGNQTVQGHDNTAGFGSGDVTDFDDAHFSGDAQVAFNGGAVQDNDIETTTTVTGSFNDESTQNVDSFNYDDSTNDSYNKDKSTNDSYNEDLDYEATATVEDSYNSELDSTIENTHVVEDSYNSELDYVEENTHVVETDYTEESTYVEETHVDADVMVENAHVEDIVDLEG